MRLWHWIVLGAVAAGTVVAAYIDEPDYFPAFYAVFGFGGGVVLIVLAKTIGKRCLMRKEDYYDES